VLCCDKLTGLDSYFFGLLLAALQDLALEAWNRSGIEQDILAQLRAAVHHIEQYRGQHPDNPQEGLEEESESDDDEIPDLIPRDNIPAYETLRDAALAGAYGSTELIV